MLICGIFIPRPFRNLLLLVHGEVVPFFKIGNLRYGLSLTQKELFAVGTCQNRLSINDGVLALFSKGQTHLPSSTTTANNQSVIIKLQ